LSNRAFLVPNAIIHSHAIFVILITDEFAIGS
jgi:hypothetical protein